MTSLSRIRYEETLFTGVVKISYVYRREPTGITLMWGPNTVMAFEVPSSCMIQMIFTNAGTTSMTVSNNGRPMNHTTKLTFFFSFLESTVLTIADWYHAVSSKVPIPAVADSDRKSVV